MAWLTAVGRVLQRMRGEINGWHSKAAVKYEKLQYAEVVKSSSTESSEWCWNKSKSLGGGIFQVVDHCWKVDHLCLHRWWASKFHPELEHYVSIRSSWYLGDVYKDIWSKLTMVLACAGFFLETEWAPPFYISESKCNSPIFYFHLRLCLSMNSTYLEKREG